MEGFQAFLVNFSDRPYLHILQKHIQYDSYNVILISRDQLNSWEKGMISR